MRWILGPLFLVSLALLASATIGQEAKTPTVAFRLDSLDGFEAVNAKAEVVSYRGRRAVHLVPLQCSESSQGSMLALVANTNFKDGTIEIDVAGVPCAGADPDARGFIGVEFRIQSRGARAENIYLRPTNGRAEDQLRRNHSVQYQSFPDFPWSRFRQENPGVYESYVDLDAGAWTKMKIEVSGTRARLYVNGADQPCLVVNDLKLGDARGQVGLWAYTTTDAYFSNLTVKEIN